MTAKSEYGVLAAIDLACNYGAGPVSAREIAERRGIPPRFLEQLFVSLRRADLVRAVRGAKGGFVLSRDPAEITVLDIVEALEGPLASSVCDQSREVGHAARATHAPPHPFGPARPALCATSLPPRLSLPSAGTQETFDRARRPRRS